MPRVVLMVGTRKGCFLLESDTERRNWEVRGPFCEGWPIYHAVHDAASGDIYAAAASEWHGAGIWRSSDLGESWQLSSEGLAYGADGLKLSKVSGLAAAHGRVLAGGEAAGIFVSRDGGVSWSLLSTLDNQPGRDDWNVPSNQPPGHLGMPGILTHPDDPARFYVVVQGFGIFETTDDGATWTPRNEGLRADWPREYDEVGFCVHKLVMAPDRERLYQQTKRLATCAPQILAKREIERGQQEDVKQVGRGQHASVTVCRMRGTTPIVAHQKGRDRPRRPRPGLRSGEARSSVGPATPDAGGPSCELEPVNP